MSFVSQIEPKYINEALNNENQVSTMHDELNQFVRNDVWILVPKFDDMNAIITKRFFRKKGFQK